MATGRYSIGGLKIIGRQIQKIKAPRHRRPQKNKGRFVTESRTTSRIFRQNYLTAFCPYVMTGVRRQRRCLRPSQCETIVYLENGLTWTSKIFNEAP